MENVFSEVRNGTIKVQPEMIDILFNCLDALEEYLANIQQTTEEGTNDNAELIKSLNDMLNKEEKEAKAEKEAPVAATAPAAESTSGNEGSKSFPCIQGIGEIRRSHRICSYSSGY